MIYPDYGTSGAPNMDPYYVSPEHERAWAEARAQSIADSIAAYADDVSAVLDDLRKSLALDGAEMMSVVIDPESLKVTIKTREAGDVG